MKSNVKRRMSHNIQQKEEKKNWSQCAWFPIYSSNVKKRRVGNFFFFLMWSWKFPTPCQKLVCPLPLSQFGGGKELVGNFHNYNVLLKSCVSLLSLSLSLSLSQFALKKNGDFLFLCLSLGTQTTRTSGIFLD